MRIGIVGNGIVGNAMALAFTWQPCKRCWGTGDVPLSREPCSTDRTNCGECAGLGKVPNAGHTVLCHDALPERSTHTLEQVLDCDLIFVCLPTPQCKDSLHCDLTYVYDFFRARHHDAPNVNYVLRSTVPIGTTQKLREQFNLKNLVHSPEFLTARTAVEDAANPTRMVIGYPWPNGLTRAESLVELYKTRWPDVPIFEVTSDESEMVKLMQNSFSAVKIAFFNEMRTLADRYDMQWVSIMSVLLSGGWINPMHTQVPGPDGKRGFSGTCLPKDVASMVACLRDAGLEDNVCFAAHTRNKKDRTRGTT